ncbi:MAG: ABC transporter substrate-binding protein [Thermoplasmata archaeon]|jgi:peptide/nickel transport system substrate-binding protein|nr:ABC transporter substrate-binding protein [Thermoplasmata archaeon]
MLGTARVSSKAWAVMAVAFLATASLGARATAEDEEGSVLKIGFFQEIDSLNPLIGVSDASWVFYGLVYDNPHCIDGQFNTVGNLVTEADPVPTTDPAMVLSGEPFGSVWEYTVTENARWHDGEWFTVDDFVYYMNLNAEDYSSLWANQPYSYYMQYAERIDSVTARVHYYDRVTGEPQPAAYAGALGIPILPRHIIEDMAVSDLAFTWNGVFEDSDPPIVGTGPFMATPDIYEQWERKGTMTLLRNPDYHGTVDRGDEVQFDRIELHFYLDPNALAEAVEDGDVDAAQLPPEQFDGLKDRVESGKVLDVATFSGLRCTQYFTEIGVCMDDAGPNPARLDPAVRKALATATDKASIVDLFYKGYADAGTTLISPINEDWHYEPTSAERFLYSLDTAGDILDAAGYRYTNESPLIRVATNETLAVKEGWVTEGTPLEFEMLVRSNAPEERDIAMYLQIQWREIGVSIDYTVIDEGAMGAIVYGYSYDLMIWYWSADVDPNYMLFCQSTSAWNGWSDNKYSNSSYDDNYSKSVVAMDPSDRAAYVDECQRIHYLDAAYIILAYPYQTYAWRTDTFTGWGDWAAEPGRSMDNFWSANPLWFDLRPVEAGMDTVVYVAIFCVSAVAIAVAVVLLKSRSKGPRFK